jgi:hypothetical protein
MDKLRDRHIVDDTGRLSPYGRAVEALPVDRAWAELLVNADDELLPFLAVSSAVESLHRMTREDRDLDGLVVRGSDHLTAYNVYAEAYREAGTSARCTGCRATCSTPRRSSAGRAPRRAGEVGRGRGAGDGERLPLGGARAADLDAVGRRARAPPLRRPARALHALRPRDRRGDGVGDHARVSKTSVCGSWGAIAGTLRYFADRFGVPRASIEGTQIPPDLLRRHAHRGEPQLDYDARRKTLVLTRRVEYFGFELEREVEALAEWDGELAPRARRVLAEALARGEARHAGVRRNERAIEEVREVWRRSGGRTAKLGMSELADLYEAQLDGVTSLEEFRARPLRLDLDALVPPEERARYADLPEVVTVRGRDVELQYDVEQGEDGAPFGVVRLRLPEKLARTLVEEELPRLDRPARFVVTRGQRGAVRAETLDDLQAQLDLPWTPDEVEERGGRGSATAAGPGAAPRGGRSRDERTHARAMGRPGAPGGGPAAGRGAREARQASPGLSAHPTPAAVGAPPRPRGTRRGRRARRRRRRPAPRRRRPRAGGRRRPLDPAPPRAREGADLVPGGRGDPRAPATVRCAPVRTVGTPGEVRDVASLRHTETATALFLWPEGARGRRRGAAGRTRAGRRGRLRELAGGRRRW